MTGACTGGLWVSVPCVAPGGTQHVLGVELSWPGPGAALRHGVLAEKVAHRPGGHSELTRDRLASGRNCPNSESRSSWPRKRLATSVNTSSSDMPRKGRPFVLSCSFCRLLGKGKQVVSQGTRHPGCDIQATYCGERGPAPPPCQQLGVPCSGHPCLETSPLCLHPNPAPKHDLSPGHGRGLS